MWWSVIAGLMERVVEKGKRSQAAKPRTKVDEQRLFIFRWLPLRERSGPPEGLIQAA